MLHAGDFLGTWVLSRGINDHLGQMSGSLAGIVTFTADDTGLIYHETGSLQLESGAVMQAERRYHWTFEAGDVAVKFIDNIDFHRFVPAGTGVGTAHLCGDDLYQCRYDFSDWPNWSAVWDVKGPRKDYRSSSRYTRG
jgi:hypothetical protein